jgi:hypothetical protein
MFDKDVLWPNQDDPIRNRLQSSGKFQPSVPETPRRFGHRIQATVLGAAGKTNRLRMRRECDPPGAAGDAGMVRLAEMTKLMRLR